MDFPMYFQNMIWVGMGQFCKFVGLEQSDPFKNVPINLELFEKVFKSNKEIWSLEKAKILN